MYLVQEWRVHHTHRAGLEGGQEDTSGMEGPTEGVQGDARIPAPLSAARRTGEEPHRWGTCVREQVGSPSPVTSTLYTTLNTECLRTGWELDARATLAGAAYSLPGPGDPAV